MKTGFDITAASEVMAILCLADSRARPPRDRSTASSSASPATAHAP
ncbi:MAG: hypothetical protein U0835_20515 [Isosphaeraceae bacterium]